MPLIQMQENNNKTFMMLHSACSCMLTSYQYTYDIFDNSCADPDFFRRRVLSDNYVWNYGKEVGCLRFIFSYFTTGIKGIRRIRSGPPTPSRFAQAVDIHSILLSFFSLLENDSILIYQLKLLCCFELQMYQYFIRHIATKVCLQIVYFTDQ